MVQPVVQIPHLSVSKDNASRLAVTRSLAPISDLTSVLIVVEMGQVAEKSVAL